MAKQPKILAAGTVVFRERNGHQQVLLIHRPAYDDWTLPKGKPKPDEDLPVAAVRETFEETGVRVRLGPRLSSVKYNISKGPKRVHYWVGQLLGQRPRRPDAEVDRVSWFDIDDARKKLTYADEMVVLDDALVKNGHTRAVLLVRHGKAMDRKNWTGPDQNRTLSSRGRKQSERIVDLLAAYGVRAVVSSSSKRCVLTVKPFCNETGIPLQKSSLLSEEGAAGKDAEVTEYVKGLIKDASGPLALCGHRPVLPAMLAGVGVKVTPMLTGAVLVAHLRSGKVTSVEMHKPVV